MVALTSSINMKMILVDDTGGDNPAAIMTAMMINSFIVFQCSAAPQNGIASREPPLPFVESQFREVILLL